MPMLSLRLVSVVICIVLTAITATLTLSVSLTFTHQAVNDIGDRYTTALAATLNTDLQSFLQVLVDEYYGLALTYRRTPMQLPNASQWSGWNGSYWTFPNVSQLSFLDPVMDALLQIGYSNNFSRDLIVLACFEDGTFLRPSIWDSTIPPQAWFPRGVQPYDGSIVFTRATIGKPDGSPISALTPAGYTFSYSRNYLRTGAPYTALPSSPVTPPTPTPWNLPSAQCDPSQSCDATDCRIRPYYRAMRNLGPRRCVWYPLFIPTRIALATGISCTVYNSAGQRLGGVHSVTSLDQITAFAQRTTRTVNSQAFVIDASDAGILGSTYPQPFMLFWRYGNATYVAATHTLVNNSLNAITLADGFDGALVSNSTHVVLKASCVAGTTAIGLYVGCRRTIDEYGFGPLRALYHTVGVDPVGGSQQNRLKVDGRTYFFAMRTIRTYADNQLVGGLRWTSVVLTPQDDILGEVGKGRTYSIVATCCFFVFAAACCYVLFTIFLAPLEGLEGKMEATANLADDDDKDERVSALKEVRGMQISFYKLRGQIRKLKTFVPQSVLASLYAEDEVEGEGGAADEVSEKVAKTEGSLGSHRDKRPSHVTSDAMGRGYRTQSASDSPNASASSTSSRGAHGKLNMALGLSKRTVTIVVFNITGLHAFAKERTMEELLLVHSKLLDAFSSLVSQGKGVVDTFQGDRFVATFNAVTPNAQHAMRAAVAATEILAAFAKLKGTLRRAAIGIATGEALVGNAGTDSQRRFCTIGRVYTHATVMERLTKQFETADVLLTHATAGALMHEFYTEVLDCVRFDVTKPMLLHALRGRKNHAMEEWNYAMAASEATDPYSSANEAWLKYLDGDALSARSLVGSAPGKHPGALCLTEILDANIGATEHADRAQGRFFTAGYSNPQLGHREG